MKNRQRKLWEVEVRDRIYKTLLPEGNLLIIASDLTKASKKAAKWLKKNNYSHAFRVIKVTFVGEIDVF